jgi:hypothetical protein
MAKIQENTSGGNHFGIPPDTMKFMGWKKGDNIVPIRHNPKTGEVVFKKVEEG